MLAAQFVWGSIPTWALFLLALVVAWRVTKGGAGSAVSELSKANEVLTTRVHDLGSEVRDLRVENAALRERTDVTLAIAPAAQRIIDETRAVATEHERAAIERHELQLAAARSQLTVLGMIAERLGPDNGNGHNKAAAA